MIRFFQKDDLMDLIIDLYDELEIDGPGSDPFTILKKIGDETIPYSKAVDRSSLLKLSKESETILSDDGFVTYYNDRDKSIARIRFSLFHEMGHIVLGHFEPRCTLNDDEKEIQAYSFASMFAVPFALVKYCNVTSIEEMMRTFKISYLNALVQFSRYQEICNGREYRLSKKERRLIEIIEKNKIKHNKI